MTAIAAPPANVRFSVRQGCQRLSMPGPSYPRRQQYRRLLQAGGGAAAGVAAAGVAVVALTAGATGLAGLLFLAVVGCVLYTRHWARLAGRSRVGARSEDEVQQALARLEAEGWRLRHSLPWRGRGDIDSLAIAPTGVGFVVETKTRAYDDRHLARVRKQAAWLSRQRRRWCRRGAVPVVCLVRPRGIERVEREVLVVSIDRLIPVLRSGATGLGRSANELGMRGRIVERKRLE